MRNRNIELVNLTAWDGEPVLKLIRYFAKHLPIKRPFRLLLQEVWTELCQNTGAILPDTEDKEVVYDGTAWDMRNVGFIRLCISPAIEYPVDWDINPALPGGYLRNVAFFNDYGETLLYLAAHECRHLWQYECPAKLDRICRLMKMDFETDADFYAIRILSRYRQSPEAFDLCK